MQTSPSLFGGGNELQFYMHKGHIRDALLRIANESSRRKGSDGNFIHIHEKWYYTMAKHATYHASLWTVSFELWNHFPTFVININSRILYNRRLFSIAFNAYILNKHFFMHGEYIIQYSWVWAHLFLDLILPFLSMPCSVAFIMEQTTAPMITFRRCFSQKSGFYVKMIHICDSKGQ